MHKGMLLVISGPSGVGKGTVCRALMNKIPALKLSVSVTTRKAREGEKDGVHYFFRTEEEFKKMIESGQFLEYACVFNKSYYGTPKKYVEDQLKSGNHVVLEIDVQGAMQVIKNYPDAVTIFIVPPSLEILKQRLVCRGTESSEMIQARLATADREMLLMDHYDYVVVNDVLDVAASQVKTIIQAESLKVERNRDMIEKWKVGGKNNDDLSAAE